MCEGCAPPAPVPGLSRRGFLRYSAAAALVLPLAGALVAPAAARLPPLAGVPVHPRDEWAGGLPPPGPLAQERPADVRFLLVHHTASTNAYGPDEVAGLIRGFHAFHTGPEKNWPDVAYNFFVDRYGGVWEGRAGSLAGPVVPDATGGSQGFAQLGCFIGDHSTEPPTPEAQRSMTALLAALADAYAIDTSPGAATTFVSRGSNRWPAGTSVTTTTIAGHRDMSLTACPGEAGYVLVRDVFPAEVTALRAARSTPTNVPTAPVPPPATGPPVPSDPGPSVAVPAPPTGGGDPGGAELFDSPAPALVGGGALLAGLAALLLRRGRRLGGSPGPGPPPPG